MTLRAALLAKGWTLSATSRRWGVGVRTLRKWNAESIAPAWAWDAIAGMPIYPA